MSSLLGTLHRGRATAERLMADACVITRPGGEPTFNEDTLQYEAPEATKVYEGRCRVQVGGTLAQAPEAGGRVYTVQRAQVSVPMSVTGVAVDDVLTVTSAAHDPDLVGARFRVQSLFHKTYATARRLEVEETQA